MRRVIDGDTVVVRLANVARRGSGSSGSIRPRSTRARSSPARSRAPGGRPPPSRGWAGAPPAFTAALLPVSRRVRLELDIERRDREGRLLAYVWRDDGVLVNLALLEAGQARLLAIPPNVRYADRFRACAAAARAARRGLWASADGRGR